jgi:hypothetical protein
MLANDPNKRFIVTCPGTAGNYSYCLTYLSPFHETKLGGPGGITNDTCMPRDQNKFALYLH